MLTKRKLSVQLDERNRKVNAAEIVQEFYTRMNTNDFNAAGQMLSDDYVLEWPQSRERIRGRRNFAALNSEYPAHGPWRFKINRIVENETEAVSDVSITDGVQEARAITFSTVRQGKIVRQVEFWPESYQAPENRRHLVEMME
ncbi:MAG TPA: nuclear transport factor 2 family protein [Anaerolineales bacterium]|nr:nuclear transport factor 2 family protein [Anaerolineales bacterium]